MENKKIKLGVVGLKRGAYVAWTLIGDDNVVIRAIADSNPEVLKACKEDYIKNGVTDLLCFDSIEELLKSDIDAVYIATDKPLHTKHTVMALEAGKHVLSEIPSIETLEEAKILRDAVKSHPELKYMAGENCFYWHFIQEWKKMYESGRFGDILYAESEYLHAPHPDEIKPQLRMQFFHHLHRFDGGRYALNASPPRNNYCENRFPKHGTRPPKPHRQARKHAGPSLPRRTTAVR